MSYLSIILIRFTICSNFTYLTQLLSPANKRKKTVIPRSIYGRVLNYDNSSTS